MSGPAGVLAVLDEAQDWLYRSSESRGDDDRAEAVKQARGAVAELIEAANRARGILALHDDRCPQLDAALANAGGAS
jgi:hypothetical protein